ncbi:MAG: histidinol-phosphatase [Pseudomonadota bacterium]
MTTARSLNELQINELTDFASELADSAGAAILPYFRSTLSIDHKPGKGEFDPVTIADRDAEARMRDLIVQRYPEHGILGEEHGYTEGSSGLTWVLDPIDGTKSFISGLPMWGTLIALYDGQQSVIGVADQPYLQERYIGSAPQSMLRNKSRTTAIKTRHCSSLSQATLMATGPDIFTTSQEKQCFDTVADAVRMTRYGGDCYAYCMLACGFVDVIIESGLAPYDIQALVPVVRHAGGRITNWGGGESLDNGQVIAVGCESLIDDIVLLLRHASLD